MIDQPQITMSLLHLDREDLTVYAVKAQRIRCIDVHAVNAPAPRQVLGIVTQAIDFRTNANLSPQRINVVAIHIFIAPCILGKAHCGQMLLGF